MEELAFEFRRWSSWVSGAILSRRMRGIKSGSIYGLSINLTLNVRLRHLAFTCHSASLAHDCVSSGWHRDGRSTGFPFIWEYLSCCTGQNKHGTKKLKCKMKEEMVFEHLDVIGPLNDSEVCMHSTEGVLEGMVLSWETELGRAAAVLGWWRRAETFCLSAQG